jgi:hypothetical protein
MTDDEFVAELAKAKAAALEVQQQEQAKATASEAALKMAQTIADGRGVHVNVVLAEFGLATITETVASPANEAVEAPVEQQPAPATQQTNAAATSSAATTPKRWAPEKTYKVPNPDNVLMNEFDTAYYDVINPTHPNHEAFCKVRSAVKHGAQLLGIAILEIMNGEAEVNGLKKSERIVNLANSVFLPDNA